MERNELKKTVIMVPTYNEKDNIARLIEEILALNTPGFDLHILVVDDNSPDGTSQIVQSMAAKNPKIKLMTRYKKKGRGTAGIDGFREALNFNADRIIEMDADFSHHPKYIPLLLSASNEDYDIVLGSRFVKGGEDKDRGFYRQIVTKLAGFYVRFLLGLRIHDVSSGYRCFSSHALKQIDLDNLISTGPSIVLEILFKSVLKGMKIREIPIIFIDRRQGVTKLNWITLLETLVMVLRLRDLKKRNQLFTK